MALSADPVRPQGLPLKKKQGGKAIPPGARYISLLVDSESQTFMEGLLSYRICLLSSPPVIEIITGVLPENGHVLRTAYPFYLNDGTVPIPLYMT